MDNVQFYLAEFLRAHGIDVAEEGEWLAFGGVRVAAILAGVREHGESVVVQLDIYALPGGAETPICESFAGFGNSREHAIGEAFFNFSVNALHVLLAALWGRFDEAQVSVEEWELAGARWRAYLGNYGVRSMEEGQVLPPEEGVEHMRAAIGRETLDGRMNWFRWYYASVQGAPTFEALKNNDSWPAGVDAMQAIAWPEAAKLLERPRLHDPHPR